ncbi:MAG: DUF1566 domain-containing protein [Gammaproteobacteria bacterium]|nr:DUF1566 domain-containing protein [Gammaproteobacteria bacterium]
MRAALGLILSFFALSANAALISRAGGQAYYDDVLNITWVADANLAATNTFGVTGINANGTMTWNKAIEWSTALNSANYLGLSAWRLPTVGPVNGSSFNLSTSYNGSTDYGYNLSEQGTANAGSTGSEMAHLFYNTLDNKGYCAPSSIYPTCTPQSGWGLSNTGPFSNIQPWYYWPGTESEQYPEIAWFFQFNTGFQSTTNKDGVYNAWAVTSGDPLSVVPLPPAVWLFGGALGMLGWLRRETGSLK